jgi:hypothetical protein
MSGGRRFNKRRRRRRRSGFLAVVRFGAYPHPFNPLSVSKQLATHRKIGKDGQLAYWIGERGWRGSKIRRWRETLVLYKSFNILCPGPNMQHCRKAESAQLAPTIILRDISELLSSYVVIRDFILNV